MKTSFLRKICTNTFSKQHCFGNGTSVRSSKRCHSNSVPQGQGLAESKKLTYVQNPDTSESLKHEDYFNVRQLVTLKELFSLNAHLGHNKGCRNDYMSPYLFGTRCEMDIFDLEQTVPLFQDALNFIAHVAYRDGVIMFLSRNKTMMPFIESTAKSCGEYAHCRYFEPGLFTDMPRMFGQRVRLPDLCIFINTLNSVFETHKGIIDCSKMLIPTVGIVDSNCDPRLISYPIPANDDSFKAVRLYLRLFKDAILAGKKKRAEESRQTVEVIKGEDDRVDTDDEIDGDDDLPSI